MIEQALLYAKLQRPPDAWIDEEHQSYDAQRLTDEYRSQLYSDEARELFSGFFPQAGKG